MLIGLYGPSRAGKDSVARCLVSNQGFEQRNLANPIRVVLANMDPTYLDQFGDPYSLSYLLQYHDWDFIKKHFPDSVDHMIALGQSMRDIDQNIWLNACVGRPYTDLVIADVRQPNEYNYIVSRGGEVWKIVSDRTEVQVRGMDGLLDGYHFEYTIDNSGTIEELETIVNNIMEKR